MIDPLWLLVSGGQDPGPGGTAGGIRGAGSPVGAWVGLRGACLQLWSWLRDCVGRDLTLWYHQAKGVKSIKDLLRGQERVRGGLLVSCVKDQMLVFLLPSEAPG